MRRATLPPAAARRGFTLVELLVAAALCVVVMYVLAQAFKAGADTLSQLKSVATLAEQLRSAETIIHRDLAAQHLEDTTGNPVMVSDPRVTTAAWTAPNRGFFKVAQDAKASDEGSDGNGLPSALATNHWMQFTCKMGGRDSSEVFAATAPGAVASNGANLSDLATASTFASRWGEVSYFLASSRAQMPPDVASPQTLFVLHRRARVVAPPNVSIPLTAAEVTANPDLSVPGSGGTVTMNTPEALTTATNRLGGGTTAPASFGSSDANFGSDILLANVVSMRVQVIDGRAPSTTGTETFATTLTPLQAIDPATRLTVPPASRTWRLVWDTNPTGGADPCRIRGVQIQLRVYDTKNLVTRQVTIAQAL